VRDLDQGTLTRVSFEGDANDPVWTPDGRRVCYATAQAGVRGVRCRRAAGGSEAESVYVGPQETTAGVFTPDGRELILIQATPTGYQLLVHPAAGGQAATLLSSPFELAWPALSPDGRWLAYVSSESGRYQVYVRPLKGEGDRVQVSADGGTEPVWSRDGRELYYVTEENGVTAVGVAATGSEFRTLGRTLLFTLPEMQTASPHANYDVDAAGRFAMVLRPAAGAVVMVLNWLTELERGGRTP
jgi:Tol biopolymer transport system component